MPEPFAIKNGVLAPARQVASCNCDERPAGATIDLLVIHCISLPPGEYGSDAIELFFTNRLPVDTHPYFAEIADLKVSSHLLIRRDGDVIQFVNLAQRAWHAGASCFEGRECCNDFSIGIELEGMDDAEFTSRQYDALAAITRCLQVQFPRLTRERIVGHEHIAPGRKTDPGPGFDWARYWQLLEQDNAYHGFNR